MVALVGEAGVALRPETGKFASEAERDIDGKLPAVAKRAAGYFAAAFAAVGVGAFLGNAISEAVDLSESASKVGVVFGQAAGQVEAFAATSASSLGISEAAALGATGTFGNLLRSTGLAEQASADMSTSMVGLAADLASFNNASPEEALDALRAGLLGEAEPLKRFGVNLNQAAIEAKALEMGLIAEDEAMTDATKATAAHALIMEQTALAQGDFERTSGGLANQQRILKAEFADVSAQIGTALLPYLSQLAGYVLDNVIPAVASGAAWFADNLGPAILEVGAFIRDELVPAFSSLIGWLQDNSSWLGIVAGVIAAVFIPHFIALQVQALITRTVLVATWIATNAQAIAAAAVHSAQVLFMIGRWVALGAAAVLQAGLTVGAWIGMGIASVVQAGIVAGAWLGAQIRTVASLAVMAAGFVAQGAVMVGAVAATVAGVVAGWVLMGVQSLINAARMAAAWLIAMGPIGWAIAAVIGLAAIVIANWDKIKAFTISAFSAIGNFVSGIWDGLGSGLKSAINGIIRVLNSGIRGINSIIGGVNDIPGVNLPTIPTIPLLHSGGIFDSGEGEGLALLRDQERVITPEQRIIADRLLEDLLSGSITAGTAMQAATGGGITVENNITQLPGENGAALAARVTQDTVWRLNGGITRRIGAGAEAA